MPKTKQIAKIEAEGRKYTVIYHEEADRPYWLYHHTWAQRKDGYGYSERKRLEHKYYDLYSLLRDLAITF